MAIVIRPAERRAPVDTREAPPVNTVYLTDEGLRHSRCGQVLAFVRRRQPSAPPASAASAATAAAAPAPDADNASPLFPPAFFEMLRRQHPMLLVFGGADRLHFEFEEKFLARHGDRLKSLPATYDVHVIERANHVLSSDAWQREMLEVSHHWLDRHFLRRAPAAALAPSSALTPA